MESSQGEVEWSRSGEERKEVRKQTCRKRGGRRTNLLEVKEATRPRGKKERT